MTFKILFSGVILATIWLFLCIMMEGKKRTCVIVQVSLQILFY